MPITARDPGFGEDAAYELSAEILRRRRARGEMPIGRKIGFTNRTIWPEYAPMWAPAYDSTVTVLEGSSGSLLIAHLAQPRIEPEIVLHFESSPEVTQDEAELVSCVDWIAHGYEIVQCHFADWKFKGADAIADFGVHGALVVGPKRPVGSLPELVTELRTFTVMLEEWRAAGARQRCECPRQPAAGCRPTHRSVEGPVAVRSDPSTRDRRYRHAHRGSADRPGETWTTEFSGIELEGVSLRFV